MPTAWDMYLNQILLNPLQLFFFINIFPYVSGMPQQYIYIYVL